ncbi:monocarboxylate transporter 12-like [Patella vulgata]|uniref:monocarboxylate transporter 12-like n=1 Tax=Patella vulgata TaxID=6465 RepID=UPI0024A94D98|nr:monocarboxylate transporter 12-like [Patella vulgata]
MDPLEDVFARNVTELIATQGVLFGLGSAMIHGPALVLLGKYFKTRRGLATSIANSGISSGAVIFPPLVRYLLDSFGLRGALLIVGGLQLNMLVFGLLLRPVESFKHKKKVTKSLGSLKDLTGSYSASYHCMGSAVTIAAVFLVIEPLFKKPLKPDDKKIGENGE